MSDGRKSGWVGWVVGVLLLAAAAAAAVWHFKGRDTSSGQYQTATVTRGDVTQAVTATGQLNPVVNIQVGSQISGIIQKLYADFNSVVTSNQVIAQLDPATYKANVQSADGNVANARASLELAQIEARRAGALHANNLISQSDYDNAVARLHQAEAQLKIQEASLERARVDLERCTIYSPVDGVIISRNVDVGQTVAASLSAPTLFIIANDLTKMQIDANVAEADVGGIEVGQQVDFSVDAFPYRTFRGEVVQVRNAPITVQNVVSYDTVIGVSNPDQKLKPGMTANVSIITAEKSGVLTIPNAAMQFRLAAAPSAISGTNANPTSPQAAARGGSRGAGRSGGRNGGGRGGGGAVGAAGGGAARQGSRTVYVLPAGVSPEKARPADLKPVRIRTGIGDGIMTEVIEGLGEGDVVITGSTAESTATTVSRPSNPFGGGGGFRRF